jgi:polyferredoxin/Fe-S-cluster-containing dehydrogenase component
LKKITALSQLKWHPAWLSMRRVRRVVQVLSLLVFLYLFVAATFLNPLPGLVDLFFRLDPLVAVTAMLAGRVWIGGLVLAGVTLVATLLFGRVWCGWICPTGTVLDLIKPRRSFKQRLAPPPDRLRLVKYVLLLVLLAAAMFGSQALMFLDPVTILTRTLAGAVWPAFGYAVHQVEAFLYQFEFLWGPLDVLHNAVIYPVFQDTRPVYYLAVPIFLFFVGLVGLNWWVERFWCRYLCPLGAMLGLVSRFSLFRRVVGPACTGCAACARHCPTDTIRADHGYASDTAECIVCFDCVDSCPRQGDSIRAVLPGWKPDASQSYDPGRREVLAAFGTAAAAAALTGVEPVRKQLPATFIRPPGVQELDFEALCIRCNACVQICATQGLQASGLEAGWQNLMTPRLEARLGHCSYNCNACGQVCPTGAIPNLTLEQKRHTPIGLARVDRSRCLPWVYTIDCIVCEETCPLGDKAIKLEVVETTNARGEVVTMQRPYVIKELCIGCGMCENKCPMGGEAAIRVFAYSEPGGYFGDDPGFRVPES